MAMGMYVGVETDVPIYETSTTTQSFALSVANKDKFFSISNGSETSGWNISNNGTNGIKLTPGNVGDVHNVTATIVLTALKNLSGVSLSGVYNTESGWDEMTLEIAGSVVINALSGLGKTYTWSGNSIAKGQQIKFQFYKDTSNYEDTASNTYFILSCDAITETVITQTQVGTERKNVARSVPKGYVGVETTIPTYTNVSYPLTVGNLNKYFFSTQNYYLGWGCSANSSGVKTYPNNFGENNSEAKITYTALRPLTMNADTQPRKTLRQPTRRSDSIPPTERRLTLSELFRQTETIRLPLSPIFSTCFSEWAL